MNTASAWIATLAFTVAAGPALADLEQAQRDGEIAASHEFVQPLDLAATAKTRDQVQRGAANVSQRERIARSALHGRDA